jgi:hypothetical protein
MNRYPIIEEEIKKVVQGMADNSVVVLSCGVFSGKSINGIVRDFHAEKGLNYHYQLTGAEGVKAQDMKVDLLAFINDNKLKLNGKAN